MVLPLIAGTRSAGLVQERIDLIVALARKHLGMDVAFVGEFAADCQLYRTVDGDGASFGVTLDHGPPLTDTYCQLMTSGLIDSVVADTSCVPLLQDMPATRQAKIGAYIGVPLRLSSGRLYGTFCCLAHDARWLDERDLRFMAMLADLLVDELDEQHQQDQSRQRIGRLLDGQSLDVAFQPIVDVHTGSCLGVEALSRFPMGFGAPDVVFDAAHSVGLGAALEALAVRKAVAFLPLLSDGQYLAVNVSPEMALMMGDGASLLDLERLPQTVLEVTENVQVDGYRALRDLLRPLREQGLRLSIDDAGAGYASLHHIIELQPDIIKIDRSIIKGIATDPSRRSAARAFVALAEDLGATVVAEGVETLDELRVVRGVGVDAVQGYLLARPSTDASRLPQLNQPFTLPEA